MSEKAWGGRFEQDLDASAMRFSASVDVDRRLAGVDVEGSIAHVRMLADRGIVSAEDAERIERGLRGIAEEIASGRFVWREDREDVHMNVEAALTERIGEAGGRLHTGRSRNDQVATDLKLWTRRACLRVVRRIDRFHEVLVARAEETVDVLLPGYTHLQRAQPVRLAHHLLAWAEMFERDRGRLVDAAARMEDCPLGSGALAGTTFALDREATARALGFARPTANSLDTVADRDFLVEALSALACLQVHASRIAEELVLWSSQEFGFVEMSDAYATGSSMMPQKKNPDIAELVRGKTGRVVGDLVALLVLLKGLPLAYNRDLQEDKPPLFDAFDTVEAVLDMLAGMLATVRFRPDRMRAALREGFLDATEMADWLAARGVPFREAHHVVGRLVAEAARRGVGLADLPLEMLRAEHAAFDASVREALDMERAVERRDLPGGPARRRVRAAIDAWRSRIEARCVQEGGAGGDAGGFR